MKLGIEHGHPSPLGATVHSTGCNFALFSTNAEKVEVCLFDDRGEKETARLSLPGRFGDTWHGFVPHIGAGQRYGYRVHGPFDLSRGHRFNHHKLLIDPYARAIDRSFVSKPTQFVHGRGDTRDSAPDMPKCVVVPYEETARSTRPNFAWRDTIIYEAHVRGLTMLCDDVPRASRGRFSGLGSDAMIAHLRGLGVTAVELLPVTPVVDEPHLVSRGLRNYWGYNPVAFLALEPRYGGEAPAREFREAVGRLHDAGIEVILDVVFNHTGEGDESGPTLCYRGIDNVSYYHLRPDDPATYLDFSGCGNTLNAAHPAVQSLVLDALVHWSEKFDIDGFRFDLGVTLGRDRNGFDASGGLLAAIKADPVLSKRKLIVEPWDVGPHGYRLGAFGSPWVEWNDRFQATVRRFWRGDKSVVADMAYRLSGSSDVMEGRGPLANVNYVASHDGMTLQDVVSYATKHNEKNGEENRDGVSDDLSWNHGVEGPTDDPTVAARRLQDKRNLVATLFLSLGVPMIAAGDEIGQSQGGNNNAYCQDNEISWIDWSLAEGKNAGFLDFVRRVISLRKSLDAVRRMSFYAGQEFGGRKDVVWLRPDGHEFRHEDWFDDLAAFGCSFGVDRDREGKEARLVLMLNPSGKAVTFLLPSESGGSWVCLVDTSHEDGVSRIQTARGEPFALAAHALVLLSNGAEEHERWTGRH